MPIYEYTCKKCGKVLEILQSSTEPQKFCGDECLAEGKPGDGELERKISLPAKHTGYGKFVSGKTDYDKAAKKGFATYRKAGDGMYEKIAGKGPETATREELQKKKKG